MRRFHRSFSRGRKPREPVSWERSYLSSFAATAFETPTQIDIFDPSAFITGSQDLRLTIRRIKLELFPAVTMSAGNAQLLTFGACLYVRESGAGPRDPFLTAAADQKEDFLWLGHETQLYGGGAAVVAYGAITPIRGVSWDVFSPDVRTMRKLTQEQLLTLSWNVVRHDPATFAAPTQTRSGLRVAVSILYSRTMRR